MPTSSNAGDGMTIERVRELSAAAQARFLLLSEDEQMLHIARGRLGAYYEVYDQAGRPRTETAGDFLTDNYGPKFAVRALENEAYRKILMVDDPPMTGGGKTIETT